MTRKQVPRALDQTDRRSLAAVRSGSAAVGTGIVLQHPAERNPRARPVIVLREVTYAELRAIGSRHMAYKWIAPPVMAAAAAGPRADCAGRSCAGRPCAGPCVCDPATLRCIKISL
jgi:hypothetical protein